MSDKQEIQSAWKHLERVLAVCRVPGIDVPEALRRIEARDAAIRADEAEKWSHQCPSCRCIVDEAGRGHHSAADCVFMRLTQ